MRHTAERPALGLPSVEGWNFGDFPYGLEPLTLPHAGEDDGQPDGLSQAEVEERYLAMAASARHTVPTTTAVTAQDLEQLYWFRWIIGHHVSFIIWRLLAQRTQRLEVGSGDPEADAAVLVHGVRGYCGMLLYTSSCTRTIYNEIIRPSMYRLHRTFSGTWAPDYRPVRSLFRGRKMPPMIGPEARRLAREVRLTQKVHLAVASKLVVGGKSLLQRSIADGIADQPHAWGSVFDCYFLTVRAPVSTHRIVAQLLRRQQAVMIDLATNGLYPDVAGGDEEVPDELREPAIADCESDLTNTLQRVSGLAAGLRLDDVEHVLDSN